MVHSLLQTNIHLQSCNFPFHYATRSSLVRSDGSGQFFFFFADRQDFCYVQDAEGSEPFTQVVCILFCNYKHNNSNDYMLMMTIIIRKSVHFL